MWKKEPSAPVRESSTGTEPYSAPSARRVSAPNGRPSRPIEPSAAALAQTTVPSTDGTGTAPAADVPNLQCVTPVRLAPTIVRYVPPVVGRPPARRRRRRR